VAMTSAEVQSVSLGPHGYSPLEGADGAPLSVRAESRDEPQDESSNKPKSSTNVCRTRV
jgi:hypothetical protein